MSLLSVLNKLSHLGPVNTLDVTTSEQNASSVLLHLHTLVCLLLIHLHRHGYSWPASHSFSLLMERKSAGSQTGDWLKSSSFPICLSLSKGCNPTPRGEWARCQYTDGAGTVPLLASKGGSRELKLNHQQRRGPAAQKHPWRHRSDFAHQRSSACLISDLATWIS